MDINDLNPVFAQKLKALLDASKREGINPGNIISGYRSVPQQAEIYARSHQGRDFMAAPPGSSMHNYGLAADISSPDIQKLRAYATAHPEMGITPLPGDAPHFQLGAIADQRSLMANPPTLPSGQTFDIAGSLSPYVAQNLPKGSLAAYLGMPHLGGKGAAMPQPPDAYGYASSVPNAPVGTTINSVPTSPPAPVIAGATPSTMASTPALPQPSIASMLGQGDFKGAMGAMGQNKGVTDSLGKLAGALGGGEGKQQPAAPSLPPPPNLQDNSASIAQMAPQLLAALIARQKQVPGLSIGGFNV